MRDAQQTSCYFVTSAPWPSSKQDFLNNKSMEEGDDGSLYSFGAPIYHCFLSACLRVGWMKMFWLWKCWMGFALSLQEIYKDRKKFSKQVFEVASSDLVNMGITVVSYTLKDIRDEEVNSRFSTFQGSPIWVWNVGQFDCCWSGSLDREPFLYTALTVEDFLGEN